MTREEMIIDLRNDVRERLIQIQNFLNSRAAAIGKYADYPEKLCYGVREVMMLRSSLRDLVCGVSSAYNYAGPFDDAGLERVYEELVRLNREAEN